VLLVCLSASLGQAGEPKGKEKPKYTNRLAKETSPYLLMHAHNPVDWYPWGAEAFEKAKKEGKLVFLSIGYSSCYWCHVMERESFANEEVAKLLNKWFVAIKVDREERPDIDNIYMTAINVMGQRGGWPLSMFLTADGKPFYGETYIPPDDKKVGEETMRGFKSLLKLVHKVHTEKAKELQEQADKVADETAKALAVERGIALVKLDRELVKAGVEEVQESYDKVYGGFGSPKRQFKGPKFPMPSHLELLLHEGVRTKSDELQKMVTHTLDHMAQGGIYDHLGGGFHRYSTERTWTVPHFEKMLYDNAQLVEVYARAFAVTKKPLYRRVVEETLAFINREMTDKGGAFYSSLDAETDGEEGRFYVWTSKELDEVLTDKAEAKLFREVHGADGKPNFEGKYYILFLPKALAEAAKERKLGEEQLLARLTPLKKKLFEARAKRPQPFLTRTVLTAWNGQMIAAYAVAGQILKEPKYVERAARAADFVLKHLRNDKGRLLRTYAAQPGKSPEARLNAYLEDYAFLVHGLLALQDATKAKKWLGEAKTLTDTMVQYYGEKDRGGFYFTSNDHEKLFARAKDQYDGAQPSGNSLAARNLVRLWVMTGEERYRSLAEKSFRHFAGTLKAGPSSLTAMVTTLSMYLDAKEARAEKKTPGK
jgi:uncharacterized protein YyaL (SSP411 family)